MHGATKQHKNENSVVVEIPSLEGDTQLASQLYSLKKGEYKQEERDDGWIGTYFGRALST